MEKLIMHHEPVDMEALLNCEDPGFVGIDYNDYLNLCHRYSAIHSFMGEGSGENRVGEALSKALDSQEAYDILAGAKALILMIRNDSSAATPLRMDEMTPITEFIKNLPEDSDIVWGLRNDETLGDRVKITVLAGTGEG